MSNRDSLGCGELIPQDVVDIFAQEKHSKRGRKKRSHSLGRALGWLKGKKKKDLGANGQNLGLGPALDLALDGHTGHQGGHKGGGHKGGGHKGGGHKSGRQAHPQGNSHAVPKGYDDDSTPAPPLLQENVFIEASRPKYLEDLHSEALEGLKMMQQEDTNNGVEYQDNESTISTMSVQTDGDCGGFTTDSTVADASSVVSGQSSVSTRSSRSGLTRQGSTFRPLNSGKKSEKAKTRKRHRRTVAGIPRHVQRELGLDRVGWALTSKFEEEPLFNSETDDSPTRDGPVDAPDSHMNAVQPKQDQVPQLCVTHAGHKDDLALLQHLVPGSTEGQRPLSLAVPSMTTANSLQQEPPSPVMSMSPQAAYMSKIIPNAVLPPSIDVVEINRGRSRNSLRTVSKSSLLLSSPAPSRASSRASSSKASSITSAARHNIHNMSDSSCWSNSESSETLVSDSSTISSSTTQTEKRLRDGDASAKEDKVSADTSKHTANGKLSSKGDNNKKEGPFVRSLSVMKAKRAPPPPNRSYSLHSKMKRRSRDLAEVRVIPGESSPHSISISEEENEKNKPESSPMSLRIDSPGYNGDTSSLDDSTGSGSPFKSQLLALQMEASKDASRGKQELQENKLSKITSPSSGYSSQDCTSPQLSKQTHSSSPKHKRGILAKLQRLFPGTTHAVSAPSPLAEVHENTKSTENPKSQFDISIDSASISPSVRALIELFNIPPPPKVHAPPPPPPEVWAHSKRSFELLLGPPAPDNIYAIIKKNPKDRRQQRQSPPASTEGSVKSLAGERKVLETKYVQENGLLNAELHEGSNERLTQNVDLKGSSTVAEKNEKVRVSDILNGMLVKAVEKRGERLAAMREEGTKQVNTQASEVKTKMDTIPAVSLARIPPSPSPPLAHHPPQPPDKQTTAVRAVASPESSWPPPPPPVGEAISGVDEVDFPLPPPPLFTVEGSVAPIQVTSAVKTEGVKVTVEAAPPPMKIPPPPSYTAPPPPVIAASLPVTVEVSHPPKEVTPPKEFCPPPLEASVMPIKSFPSQVQVLPTLVEDVSPTLVNVVSPPQIKEVPTPHVIAVNPVPPEAVSILSSKEVSPPPSSQEDVSQSSEEVTLVSSLCPPQSIPAPPPTEPAPPLQPPAPSSEQRMSEGITSNSGTDPVSCDIVLTPPQSIPPPPPLEPLTSSQVGPLTTDAPAAQEVSHSPPAEASIPSAAEISPSPERSPEPAPSVNIPLPPPLPVQGLASVLHQQSPESTKMPEPTCTPVVQEDPTLIVTPSLLQMVKLRSVNSSPEPPKAQEQAQTQTPAPAPAPDQAEVTIRTQQPSNPAPTSATSSEAPQKPIRKSLIMTSPTPTSPPAIATSQPALPKSQSAEVQPASSSAVSPTKKSPPAITVSRSMNLQEAIRMRTAARSKDSPASRLSLHSLTSPKDLCKSPTSTASFIFSKSHKKVVMETKPAPGANATAQKHLEVSSKAVKMPPPVAKKPTKAKETESGDGAEPTAGQEAQPENISDTTEKTAGTVAGTADGRQS